MNSSNKKTPAGMSLVNKPRVAVAKPPAGAPRPFARSLAQPKLAVPVKPQPRSPKPPVKVAKPPVVQTKRAVAPAKPNALPPRVKNPVVPLVQRPQLPLRPSVQTKPAGPTQVRNPPVAPKPGLRTQAPLNKTRPAPFPIAIQRKVIAARPSGVIQRQYAVDAYVTVFEEGGAKWYGVITNQLVDGYKIRLGGGSKTDTVDVPEEAVHPHPSFAGRYEEHRDNTSVSTAGGKWTARKYSSIMGRKDPSVRGAHMELEFLPGAFVDATRIVLVQTVKAVKNGQVYFINQSVQARSVNNVAIDQEGRSVSPEYAADPAASPLEFGGVFGGAPVQDEAGSHGYRVKCYNPERWQAKEAWLKDRPHLSGVIGLSSQEFETTAIAAAGTDKGRYYGSVKWGWFWRGPGHKVELIPLKVKSFGSVSKKFIAAAKKWNSVLTSGFVDPVKLPLPNN